MNQSTTDLNGTPITMVTQSVTAKPRRLSAKWTVEPQQDLEAAWGIVFKKPEWFWWAVHEVAKRMKWCAGGGWHVEGPWLEPSISDEMAEALAEEITKEIDNEVLNNLTNQFKHQGS